MVPQFNLHQQCVTLASSLTVKCHSTCTSISSSVGVSTSSDASRAASRLSLVDIARTIVNNFVISRIDYCNCLLAGAPQYQLNRLQAVMNSAGRLICGLSKFDHISQVLHDRLHWLAVAQRIHYRLCLLVYKALHGLAPQYLTDFCQPVSFCQWQKRTVIIHAGWLHRRLNINKLRVTILCCNHSSSMEPIAIRHLESAVAGIFQTQTQDSFV